MSPSTSQRSACAVAGSRSAGVLLKHCSGPAASQATGSGRDPAAFARHRLKLPELALAQDASAMRSSPSSSRSATQRALGSPGIRRLRSAAGERAARLPRGPATGRPHAVRPADNLRRWRPRRWPAAAPAGLRRSGRPSAPPARPGRGPAAVRPPPGHAAAGFVHQVEADHHPVGDLQHLQHQVQVALQPGGIDDDHGHIGLGRRG